MPGIWTSSSTRSGRTATAFASASRPSRAVTTSKPSSRRLISTKRRMSASSSATSTVAANPYPSLRGPPGPLDLGLLEACGLVPRSGLRGIRVVFLGDDVGHQVLAVDGQALERLTLIAGGQRVGDGAVLHDAGEALLEGHDVHGVVQTPPGLASVDQQIPGHLKAPFISVGCHTVPSGGSTQAERWVSRGPGFPQRVLGCPAARSAKRGRTCLPNCLLAGIRCLAAKLRPVLELGLLS